MEWGFYTSTENRFNDLLIYVTYVFTGNTSVWLTVSFTLERYVAVKHPILRRNICTTKRAKRIIYAIFLLSFLSALPTPFEWEVVTTTNEENVTQTVHVNLEYSDFGKNEIFRSIYYWYLAIGFVLIPLITLVIFNSLLIYSLRSSRLQLNNLVSVYGYNDYGSSMRQVQEKGITVMLISVIIFFIVCQTPTAVTLIYSHFWEPPAFTWEWTRLRIMGNIFNSLVTLNCASNFVLYCMLSTKFRKTLRHLGHMFFVRVPLFRNRSAFLERTNTNLRMEPTNNNNCNCVMTSSRHGHRFNLDRYGTSNLQAERYRRISDIELRTRDYNPTALTFRSNSCS
jgi:hypothetical protein